MLPLILISFCEHLALCLGKYFSSKTDKKRRMELSFTYVPALLRTPSRLASPLLPTVQVPWRYRLSRRSSDRYLLHTGALLRSALDPWRLGDGVQQRSSTLRCSPRLFFRLGTWNPSCSTPGSNLPRLILWWCTPRAPSIGGALPTGASVALSAGSSAGGT